MKRYWWRRIETDPSRHPWVRQQLWIHGDVYGLVQKGILWDTPLHCYASFARSRFSMLVQFGTNCVICDILNQPDVRSENKEKALARLQQQGITPATLLDADIQHPDLHVRGAFFRCLTRFVRFYFRA